MQSTAQIDESETGRGGFLSALRALMPTSLGGRMALAASSLAALLVIGSILIISHFVDATVARLTTRELTETARAEGQRVVTRITEAMQAASTLDAGYEALLAAGHTERSDIAEVLFRFVDGEPMFAGAWFGVEPNALDGNDANVARDGWLAHPETGHFRPYVYNFGNGAQRHYLSFADAEGAQSDYYRIPMTTGEPYVTNPVPYLIDGQWVLLLSAAFPVSRDGEVIGVVGVDFDLSALSAQFASIRPYGDGVVSLISHDLMWAATSDAAQLGEPVAEDADFWPTSELGPSIPQEVTIVAGENGLLHLLSPIHLRQFDRRWMVVISVPETTVMADAVQIRQLVLYTGVGLVICVILALLSVSHLLVRQPIRRSIEAIQKLEDGKLSTPIPETDRRDEIGDINRALFSFRDSLKHVRELEAADRAKSQFLANMSHEIRTPLNGVLAASQMLDKTELSGDQAEYLRIIRSSGTMLFDLIRDVLDLSKIESGQIRLASEEFRLVDLIQRSADAVGALATQKGLDLRVDINPKAASSYRGDETRICQIVTNLVGNAVKFTEDGHVAIRVDRTRKGGQVRIRVEDTGPGIAKENLDRVFDRFSQIDETDTREFGGSGLGLAISRQFARLMGGDIKVRSKLGGGSCFTVMLPLDQVKSPELPKALVLPKSETGENSGFNVLVVEDIASNRFLLAQFLKASGHKVIEAENGREALEYLDSDAGIDVVLMDLQMPVMSGDDALREIRRTQEAYRDVPVIMVTADADTGTSETLRAAGATACLTKPVDFVALKGEIVGAVAPRRAA